MKERGISSYRLHKDTNITQSTIANWLQNKTKPDANKLDVISSYFGVSVDWIINDNNADIPKKKNGSEATYNNRHKELKVIEVTELLTHMIKNANDGKDLLFILEQYKLLFSKYEKSKEVLMDLINETKKTNWI